jgi:phospholipid-binding lipoprotein MlaA
LPRSSIVPVLAMMYATLALALGGCAAFSRVLGPDATLLAGPALAADVPAAPLGGLRAGPEMAADVLPFAIPPSPDAGNAELLVLKEAVCVMEAASDLVPVADTVMASDVPDAVALLPADIGLRLAQAQGGQKLDAGEIDAEREEYDPWESFNEKMFAFNLKLDRYVLKPVAKVYGKIVPAPIQILINNGFDNIHFVPRFVNSVLQGKWGGAAREIARFLLNSTAGIGGLFDPAKDYWGIEKSREDFGQTLGTWGAPPGPYLVLPFLAPMTVRDGIGTAVDNALDPLGYYLPFVWDRIGMKLGDIINERSLNLDLYEGFQESVLDLYSAVRNAYLRRREQLIKE